MRDKKPSPFCTFWEGIKTYFFFYVLYALESVKRTWIKADLLTKNVIYILLFSFVEKDFICSQP